MNDTQCVRDFMLAMQPDQVPSVPGLTVRDEIRLLRARLVLSEALELCEALGVDVALRYADHMIKSDEDLELFIDPKKPVDIVEAADACADLRYVVVGTEVTLGIPGDAVFAEVHRSNMQKLGPDGRPTLDEGGKVLKPEGWTPPDVAAVLARHREEATTC